MKRPLAEVLTSQKKMLQRLGRKGSTADKAALGKIFERQLAETERRLATWQNAALLVAEYHQVIREPEASARAVAQFLGLPLNIAAMTRVVDPNLHRQRQTSGGCV